MSELKDLLRKDEQYRSYRNIFRTVQEGLDLQKTLKEATFLHKSRKSRLLFEARVSPQKLQDAILMDMSNRSRLTELKSLLLNEQELLSTAISLGKKHVRATYATILKEYGSTKDAQMLVVDKVFSSGTAFLAEIDSAVEILDLFVRDIDQAGFSLRNVVETLKMMLERRETSTI